MSFVVIYWFFFFSPFVQHQGAGNRRRLFEDTGRRRRRRDDERKKATDAIAVAAHHAKATQPYRVRDAAGPIGGGGTAGRVAAVVAALSARPVPGRRRVVVVAPDRLSAEQPLLRFGWRRRRGVGYRRRPNVAVVRHDAADADDAAVVAQPVLRPEPGGRFPVSPSPHRCRRRRHSRRQIAARRRTVVQRAKRGARRGPGTPTYEQSKDR